MRPLFLAPFAVTLATTLSGCGMSLGFLDREKPPVSRAETIPVLSPNAPVGSIPGAAPGEDSAASEARRLATLLLPEGAGAVLRLKEKNFPNGARQEIIIATDRGTYGENVIDVSIRTEDASPRFASPLLIGPPTENGVRNEILSRFPDVQMNIVTRPMRNGLGPFGLAIGKHPGGARCVFAWQWIDELREASPGSSSFTKMNALIGGKALAASIRIRLCRSDSTIDQLAAHIEGLSVASAAALERIAGMDRRNIGSAPAAAVASNGGGALLKPVGGTLEAAIAKPVKRDPPPRAKPPAPRPKPEVRHQEAPPPKTARRAPRPAAQEPAPVAAAPPPAPVYARPPVQQAPAAYGQRYLGPVSGGAPQPSYGGPAPGAPQQGGISLPAAAYRGPGA
jgi:hypothetical protein